MSAKLYNNNNYILYFRQIAVFFVGKYVRKYKNIYILHIFHTLKSVLSKQQYLCLHMIYIFSPYHIVVKPKTMRFCLQQLQKQIDL